MGSRSTARRLWNTWLCGVSAAVASLVPCAVAQNRYLATSPAAAFARAERLLEQLQSIPEEQRTGAEYDRALDAFRAVYHTNPGDLHAAESVYEVAQLLADEGRTRHDTGLLRAALAQYEYLRKQYPGSSWRVGALLDEGQIDARDLGDPVAARDRWQLLLQLYPGSASATEARAELAGMHSATSAEARNTAPQASRQQDLSVPNQAATTNLAPPFAAINPNGPAPTPPPNPTTLRSAAIRRNGEVAAITGIRHWSTPSYTRVAIDLGDEVQFQAARVTGPDRIYFDLLGTRLAPELVGKSFAVTDDGFLTRIRAAQFSDNMTRVVLDVNQVTEYSAFLLPNPYRLIIDIHGARRTSPPDPSASTTPAPSPTNVPAPSTARVVTPTKAKPVPNTVTVPATATTAEVARVSDQPGRTEATSVPTSAPVAEVVRRRPANLPDTPTSPDTTASGSPAPAPADAPLAAATAPPPKKIRKSRAAAVSDGNIVGVPGSVATVPGVPARAAVPTADGETSLVRALGLKVGRIVIDAGHGGHDSGTLGVDGIEEKDVVLDVALRLGKLLHERLGAEVIYTRSDDTFIPLETRTAIANKAQADLFLSIHANSSPDASARGVETYYLNFTTDPTALNVAARENAVSNQSVGQLSDLVKKIALKDKIAESREFAADVEASLYAGLAKGNAGLRDRGVKKAPFVVLIGANMPSVLAEISFVTNPRDAGELRQPDYRERVAESLYHGVAKYEAGLSGGTEQRDERVATTNANPGR